LPAFVTHRPKYQALFDPRCQRATNTGAAAQAEHVTGTHLYAFLQDTAHAALAAGGKKSVPNVGAVEDQNGVDQIREVYTVRTRTIVAYLFSLCGLIAHPADAAPVYHAFVYNTYLGGCQASGCTAQCFPWPRRIQYWQESGGQCW
jgi:hypothetical protein